MFVGRGRELQALTEEFTSNRPSLVIVYGRRRVGKSTLLRYAVAGRPHVYYQATRVADLDAQALVKAELARATGDSAVLAGLTGWEAILGYLVQLTQEDVRHGRPPRIFVLDEFPYLCEGAKELPSVVQKVWDAVRADGVPVKLVLCGSHVAFMEDLLVERNPLHGRQSRALEVSPLPYRDAVRLVPRWPREMQLQAYGVFGGLPYYWSLCEPALDLAANIVRLVLADGAPLLEEPAHLLQAELNAPARYASILRAVADGLTDRGDIVNRVLEKGEQSSGITPYIDRLTRMRLLHRLHSLDVAAPERARNARYYLADQFLAFYYHFVLPNLSAIRAGHGAEVYRLRIAPRLDGFMGARFEEIAREYVALYGQERLPAPAQDVGKIWAASYDIDVAGTLLDGHRIAGECKWWKDRVGLTVLEELRASVAANGYYAGTTPRLLIFARRGFTPELRAEARAHPKLLHLLTPRELLAPPDRKRGLHRRSRLPHLA